MYRRRRGISRQAKPTAQDALNRAEEEHRRPHDETLRRKDIPERELRVRNSLTREAHRKFRSFKSSQISPSKLKPILK